MNAVLWADAPVGLCVVDARLHCEVANRWAGWPDAVALPGPGLLRAVPALAPVIRQVLAGGRPIAALEIEGPAARAWLCAVSPVSDGDGAVRAVSCAITDVTEWSRARQAGHAVSREIDHRGQNVLSLVLGLLRLAGAAAPDDTAHLIGTTERRVLAMARVHNVLSRDKWTSGDLREIALAEFAAHDGHIDVDGDPIGLTVLAGQKLALVLHELVTNAALHGALSTVTGRVSATWRRNADGVALTWIERGGPRRSGPPAAAGFGTWLIDTTVADQLDGTVARLWEPAGLRCEIRLGRTVLAGVADRIPGAPLVGRRVLVAMEGSPSASALADVLRAEGCAVLRVAHDTQDAIGIALAAGVIDAAVVDATAGGRSTQPLVALLKRRAMAIVHVGPLVPVPQAAATEIVVAPPGGPVGLCDTVVSALRRLLAPA